MFSVLVKRLATPKKLSLGNPKFNKSKNKTTMKKIFYILASAIVALGAIACENEGLENVAPEVNGTETLSFTATIDNTKTALDGLKTIWVKGDVVMIDTYEFVCQEDLTTFTCTGLTEDQVATLKAAETLTATYSKNKDGKVDSAAGVAGAVLQATGNFTAGFNFSVKSAFLKFTTTGIVTLEGEGLFSTGNTYTTTDVEGGEYYVAINPTNEEITFTASSYGAELKSTSFDFDAKKLYDLGTLTPYNLYIEDNSGYKKMCVHGWNTTSGDPILGAGWPGVEATALAAPISYKGKTYNKVVPLSDKVVATEKYGFVLNNGNMGSQYGNYEPTTASNLFYTANPKTLLYIKASGKASSWTTLKCYMWKSSDTSYKNWDWPGLDVNKSNTYDIYSNSEKYYCYDAGENKEFDMVILNDGGSNKTGDTKLAGKSSCIEVKDDGSVYTWVY